MTKRITITIIIATALAGAIVGLQLSQKPKAPDCFSETSPSFLECTSKQW